MERARGVRLYTVWGATAVLPRRKGEPDALCFIVLRLRQSLLHALSVVEVLSPYSDLCLSRAEYTDDHAHHAMESSSLSYRAQPQGPCLLRGHCTKLNKSHTGCLLMGFYVRR